MIKISLLNQYAKNALGHPLDMFEEGEEEVREVISRIAKNLAVSCILRGIDLDDKALAAAFVTGLVTGISAGREDMKQIMQLEQKLAFKHPLD